MWLHYNLWAGPEGQYIFDIDYFRDRSPQNQALRGVIFQVTQVRISENESFETALKRFSRKIQQEGVLAEARRREHFEKPSMKRKRKEAARRRKMARKS